MNPEYISFGGVIGPVEDAAVAVRIPDVLLWSDRFQWRPAGVRGTRAHGLP